ncbi:hypothetical protein ABFS82_14G300100 [Erythranthe guttata]|uniref:Uncharacterized protein n=1 Tax=Erythranthe guttata TaxID=4155 RepID=A0A022RAM5_ERYGU|nr:PREDICTED: uncharacterized protein LOC105958829 [Erythranthe guttata]EYU36788.1 hypothetical protein MIMGU_mgv1a026139mg [Erythranthe guttata]|eukprot:XP_012838286.1 PREDICTED: uncharacterized protein LOC105958829 [Erythranthe guttata]
MGWFVRERKGISWKDQTLESISAPPLPLVVFSVLLIVLLYFETSFEQKERVERNKSGFRFGLLLLPLVVVLAVNMTMLRHKMLRYNFGAPKPVVYEAAEDGTPVARLLLFLLLLILMVHYQSSFHSSWFRLF